jgi:hypothetical protein
VVATPHGPTVVVRTWTDGRAWVKVRTTRNWPGGRLFGDLGALVRPVKLPGGTGYSSEDGARIGIHAQGMDVLVTGSLAAAALERVAGSLAVAGRPVPSSWAEAATATLDRALAAAPGRSSPNTCGASARLPYESTARRSRSPSLARERAASYWPRRPAPDSAHQRTPTSKARECGVPTAATAWRWVSLSGWNTAAW